VFELDHQTPGHVGVDADRLGRLASSC